MVDEDSKYIGDIDAILDPLDETGHLFKAERYKKLFQSNHEEKYYTMAYDIYSKLIELQPQNARYFALRSYLCVVNSRNTKQAQNDFSMAKQYGQNILLKQKSDNIAEMSFLHHMHFLSAIFQGIEILDTTPRRKSEVLIMKCVDFST